MYERMRELCVLINWWMYSVSKVYSPLKSFIILNWIIREYKWIMVVHDSIFY